VARRTLRRVSVVGECRACRRSASVRIPDAGALRDGAAECRRIERRGDLELAWLHAPGVRRTDARIGPPVACLPSIIGLSLNGADSARIRVARGFAIGQAERTQLNWLVLQDESNLTRTFKLTKPSVAALPRGFAA
jgi:hypothetical protein